MCLQGVLADGAGRRQLPERRSGKSTPLFSDQLGFRPHAEGSGLPSSGATIQKGPLLPLVTFVPVCEEGSRMVGWWTGVADAMLASVAIPVLCYGFDSCERRPRRKRCVCLV